MRYDIDVRAFQVCEEDNTVSSAFKSATRFLTTIADRTRGNSRESRSIPI